METIETKAKEIFNEVAPQHELSMSAAGEHPLLDWLIENLPQLIKMLLACLPMARRNAAGLAEALRSPNLRQRAGIRFFIARNIDDPRTANVGAREMTDAFYKIGRTTTEQDAAAILQEVAA